MTDDDYSRREFLKKFAYLSSGALCLSATAMACYGPGGGYEQPPEAMVSDMFFYAGGLTARLQSAKSVPLNTTFTVEFTDNMNTTGPATVFLIDANTNDVSASYVKKWDTVRILTLTPSPDFRLLSNMEYTLQVGEDLEDSGGDKILITENATATFTTAMT